MEPMILPKGGSFHKVGLALLKNNLVKSIYIVHLVFKQKAGLLMWKKLLICTKFSRFSLYSLLELV